MSSAIDRVRETERLRLVPIDGGLTDDLLRLHTDDAIAEWYDGHWTRERVQARAESFGTQWEQDGISKWMAYERETGELVGRGGLSWWDFEGRHLELGWALLGAHWGKGYATEIGRAGLDVGFDELGADHVYAFTEPHNERSRAVMERLGMAFVRDITWEDGPYVLYEITRGT